MERTWLITGCSSGLGKGIAKAVLARGDRAALTARDPAALAASAVDTGLLRKPFGLFLLWSGGTMLLGAFRRPDSGQTEE